MFWFRLHCSNNTSVPMRNSRYISTTALWRLATASIVLHPPGFDTDLVWARDTTTGECALGERLVNPGASEYNAGWHDGLYAQCVDASATTASVRCCAPRTPSL